MIEIIKFFVETPHKRERIILAIVKLTFLLFVAAKLFVWLKGPFEVIDVLDLKQWAQFVTSGNILICIFLYLVADIILYSLLSTVSDIPLKLLAKRNTRTELNKDEGDGVIKLLQYFELLKFDERKKRPIATKYTKSLLKDL